MVGALCLEELACHRLHHLSKTLVAIFEAVKNLQNIAVHGGFRRNSFEPGWGYSGFLRQAVILDSTMLLLLLIFRAIWVLQGSVSCEFTAASLCIVDQSAHRCISVPSRSVCMVC